VVTSGERTKRRIAPILRRQKEKCNESYRTQENSALKYRKKIGKRYRNIDFRGKIVPNFRGQKEKCTEV
jgi:hypothetical protein